MTLRYLVPAVALLLVFPITAQRQRGADQPTTPNGTPAPGATAPPPGTPKPSPDAPTVKNPLPADKSVAQTVTVNGHTLHYTATVGSITLKSHDDKPTGVVMYTAYTLDGPKGGHRPVMFALNGGPGAASVYLNLGAIGPKHISFANVGDSPSDPATLIDNPGTWLDFTDLVFIDPIGTGFSRTLVDEAETKKLFYGPTPDIEYLSLVVYKWLVANDRLLDKKYLMGESYGGYRGPRMTHYLQSQLGVAMNGLVLVSPYLNPQFGDGNLSPIPWMVTLPSITAAHLENEGKLTPQTMQDVIAYTRGEYAETLLKGRSDPAATQAMIEHVTAMTGLDPQFVKYSGGRLDTRAYLREVHRSQGLIGSVYDSNVTSPDPFPYAAVQQSSDPILESIIAPTTTAMVDFITHTVGWKTDARFYALSSDVNQKWDRQSDLRSGAVADLREAVAADPKLRVLIVHGWNDLSCPFMGSVLSVDQMPPMGDAARVSVHEFPGGHMFYTRPANQTGLHELAEQMVAAH
ncbi:MAG: peptidase S10 [Acidobacteriota bacterium]|nr:peptidase S10 [Acidobacteriota bacterium]